MTEDPPRPDEQPPTEPASAGEAGAQTQPLAGPPTEPIAGEPTEPIAGEPTEPIAGEPTQPLASPPQGWVFASSGPTGPAPRDPFAPPPSQQPPSYPASPPHEPPPYPPSAYPQSDHEPPAQEQQAYPLPAGPGAPEPEYLTFGEPPRPQRRYPMGLIAAGGAVLIAGASFAAGLAVGGNRATLSDTSAPIAGAPNGSGPGLQGGQGGGGSQGNGPGTGQVPQLPSGVGRLVAAGRITAVNGSTLTIDSLFGGGSVTVHTTGATQVEQDLGGSVSALQEGQVIFVVGTRADDGSVTAAAIADRPFFGGRGNGFGQGGQGGQSGQGGQGGQGGTGQTAGTVLNG